VYKENMMNGVNLSRVEVAHEDERRRLSAIFNGEFTARQVKIIHVKKASTLGNHYHHYSELFYVAQGGGTYTFESIKTGERQVVTVRKGDRIIIGRRIAHKAELIKGTVLIEATEKPYLEALLNDYSYEVK